MPINKNHEFEELNGIKCGIVERNVSASRVAFLRELLAYNGYKVIIVPSPPAKVTTAPAATETEAPPATAPVETFTVGVTDYTFNPINAIFGRLLHTPGGHIVTLAYWQQKEDISHDDIPF